MARTPTSTPTQPAFDATSLLASALMPNRGQELIMQEIISVFQTLKGDGTNPLKIAEIVKGIASRVPYIVLIILIHHYIGNTKDMVQGLSSLLWRLTSSAVYRTNRYSMEDARSLEYYQAEAFTNAGKTEVQSFGIPLYIATVSQDRGSRTGSAVNVVQVQYIPWVHSKMVDQIENTGKERFDLAENGSNYYLYSADNYRSQQYGKLFPSNNNLLLEKIVRDHVDVEWATNYFRTVGILINGMPGLGKSKSAEYIAASGIVSNVHRVDLNQKEFMTRDPDTLFKGIFRDIPVVKTSLFVIDEMDKWLVEYIERSYIKLETDALKSNSRVPSTTGATLTDPVLVPPKEQHVQNVKRDFMLALLSVLERNDIRNSCIVVFCCNNFETIFDNIEMTHYNSLKSRFMHLDFHPCDSSEIRRFYKYYNEKYQAEERTARFYNPDIDRIMNNLDPKVCVTYRKLSELSTFYCYRYEEIVEVLNKDYCYGLSATGSPLIGSPKNDKGKSKKKVVEQKEDEKKQEKKENEKKEEKKDEVEKKEVEKKPWPPGKFPTPEPEAELKVVASDAEIDESSMAASSGSHESLLCEVCEENKSEEVFHGIPVCIDCLENGSLTEFCWFCSNEAVYALDRTKIYIDEDGAAARVCETCLPKARERWPDYVVHALVACENECDDEPYVRPITSSKKKFDLCYMCNDLSGRSEPDLDKTAEVIECIYCELCLKDKHHKMFYCPEIDSNCCDGCSREYVARKEIRVVLNTKQRAEYRDQSSSPIHTILQKEPLPEALKVEEPFYEVLKVEDERQPPQLLEVPVGGLFTSLTVIKCNKCSAITLDPQYLSCVCCKIVKTPGMKYAVGGDVYVPTSANVTLETWSSCVRCNHGANIASAKDIFPEYTIHDMYEKKDALDLTSILREGVVKAADSNNLTEKVIFLLQAVYTTLTPRYLSVAENRQDIRKLIKTMIDKILSTGCNETIGQHKIILQKAAMLTWTNVNPPKVQVEPMRSPTPQPKE